MKKLFLIYGGKSAEHAISILTAYNVLQVIDYQKYEVYPIFIHKSGLWTMGERLLAPIVNKEDLLFTKEKSVEPIVIKQEDSVVFPLLHGPNGEDGTIQGLFEMFNIAYVGTGVLASACGMDKIISKKLFAQANLPQLPYVAFNKQEWITNQEEWIVKCEKELAYPMFVKPANMGSSVGVSKATNIIELVEAVKTALQYDRRIVVELGVIARELEIGVLGNDNPQASVVGELVKTADFYDYDEKYVNNQVTMQIPAKISEELSDTLRQYALTAYQAIDGSGLTRCDFFVTEQGDIYINEVNTLPGFTQFSMYPKLWEASDISYKDLVQKLIDLAVERYHNKQLYQITAHE